MIEPFDLLNALTARHYTNWVLHGLSMSEYIFKTYFSSKYNHSSYPFFTLLNVGGRFFVETLKAGPSISLEIYL